MSLTRAVLKPKEKASTSPAPKPKESPVLKSQPASPEAMSIAEPEPTPEQAAHDAYLSKLFKAMFAFQILLNIVDGCLPASLVKMSEEKGMHLSFAVEGAMGALVYVGLVAASLIAGPIFDRFLIRKVIAYSSFGVGVFVIMFGLAPNIPLLLISRFGIGVSLAFITIYAPVWVDEFAPTASATMWMSLLQLAIPLGMIL